MKATTVTVLAMVFALTGLSRGASASLRDLVGVWVGDGTLLTLPERIALPFQEQLAVQSRRDGHFFWMSTLVLPMGKILIYNFQGQRQAADSPLFTLFGPYGESGVLTDFGFGVSSGKWVKGLEGSGSWITALASDILSVEYHLSFSSEPAPYNLMDGTAELRRASIP